MISVLSLLLASLAEPVILPLEGAPSDQELLRDPEDLTVVGELDLPVGVVLLEEGGDRKPLAVGADGTLLRLGLDARTATEVSHTPLLLQVYRQI